jgi:hypothetical protein
MLRLYSCTRCRLKLRLFLSWSKGTGSETHHEVPAPFPVRLATRTPPLLKDDKRDAEEKDVYPASAVVSSDPTDCHLSSHLPTAPACLPALPRIQQGSHYSQPAVRTRETHRQKYGVKLTTLSLNPTLASTSL